MLNEYISYTILTSLASIKGCFSRISFIMLKIEYFPFIYYYIYNKCHLLAKK
jgi:hypothetical protein